MATAQSRNLVLVGFMGTGKSCVGRRLARLLDLTFEDLDEAIVRQAGKPIPRIFAEDGEPTFRRLEHDLAVAVGARAAGLVVATGGGIVLNPANITALTAHSVVVCLTARPETVLARVGHDTNRPLLACVDKLGRIRELMAARAHLYAAIPLQVPTDEADPAEVARRVAELYRTAP